MKQEEDLFAGLRPPRPDDGLRERVLSAASRVPVQSPGWVDRLWESRQLARAWRVAALLLLGAHLVLLWGKTGAPGHEAPPSSAEAGAFEGGLGARLLARRESAPRSTLSDIVQRLAQEREQGL